MFCANCGSKLSEGQSSAEAAVQRLSLYILLYSVCGICSDALFPSSLGQHDSGADSTVLPADLCITAT